MGSKNCDIVPYIGGSRSRSRSRSRSPPPRGPPAPRRYSRGRSRSRSGNHDKPPVTDAIPEPVSVRASMATSKVDQLQLAKTQAGMRVEAARKAVDTAQKELEEAMSQDHELTSKLQVAMSEASKIKQEERIQKLVDERFEAKRSREFEKADRLYEDLRAMGVQVTGSQLSWTGPGGLSGKVQARRPGDWECVKCDILVVSKGTKCFKCGARKPGTSGGDDRDDRRGGGGGRRGRRSPSYDDRGRGPPRGGGDRGGGGRMRRPRSDSYSGSPPPRRR